MKHSLFGIAFVFASIWCSLSTADSITAKMEQIRVEQDLSGIAWVLLDENGQRSGVSGYRNFPTKSPLHLSAQFHLGSVTKVILATGVLRMASVGLIALDDPIANYLPAISIENPWPDAPVTVRHLMDHTAGFEDARLWQLFSSQAEPGSPLLETLTRTRLRVRSRPGERYSYSNLGFTLLAAIVEQASGARYEAYLDRLLLEPIGMHSSTFGFTTQVGPSAAGDLVWGHLEQQVQQQAVPTYFRPAGQFTATIDDLGQLLSFLLGDGKLRDDEFIQTDLMDSRGRPVRTNAAKLGLEAGYGLGLARRDRHGVVGFCHPGNTVGFRAMICLFPEYQKAFAYMSNTDSETADYEKIAAALISELSIPPAPPPTIHAQNVSVWVGFYVPAPNRFDQFRYLDRVFGVNWLRTEGNRLVMHSLQRPSRELRFTDNNLLVANDRSTTSHVLIQHTDGQREMSDGFSSFRRVSFIQVLALSLSLLWGLLGVLWFASYGLIRVFRRVGLSDPELPAATVCWMILLSFPLFALQSFIELGDKTLASMVLALATGLLPIGSAWTLLRCIRTQTSSKRHGWFAFGLLQWSAVLYGFDALPLMLWA